jgi:hypothetical protein
MSHLLAFDPGNTTGWAYFQGGVLVCAGYGKLEEILYSAPGLTVGDETRLFETDAVLIEKPQWRPHDKIDINDIITLAVAVGELKRAYWKPINGPRIEEVFPTTWKGSVPKDVHNKRVLSKLTPQELAQVPLRPRAKTPDHNCVDAVGLGLWKLGRLR